jgi:VIT1/CCC1 family predicted Fe2+/Mn2+ transporter
VTQAHKSDIKRFRANLRDEMDGAALYEELAAAEPNTARRDVFLELAQAEREHAELWRTKLEERGIRTPSAKQSFKTKILRMLIRRFGPRFVLPAVAANEFADRDKYANQPDSLGLSADEHSHAAVVAAAAQRGHPGGVTGSEIARAESWHRGASGNDLRAAVLGANDGLVSNFCLIMGVAGAGSPNKVILLTGLAGLIAGACSMALGEWLSVTNARELASTQIALEADELEHTPESEQRELALIYQAKGLDKDEAHRVAEQIMRDHDKALDTLTREELGIDPDELGGNPWSAAGASFGLFSLGAIFPAMPFFWLHGLVGIAASVALSIVGLGLIGMFTSLFNGRTPWFSSGRQIVIGCAAAAFTYGVGALLGVSMS